jgi:hypothetical protein
MEALGNNLVAKSGKKVSQDYFCEKCDYTCSKIYNWKKHLLTSKHTKEMSGNDLVAKSGKKEQNYMCELCDKYFNTNAGLWKHKKNCKICKNTVAEPTHTEDKNDSKDDLIQYLISENKEFKNLILEFVKKDNSNITNNTINNTNNSHNKTFNLQFFLNETCKDAMNMSDFINSLTIQLSDLENVGKLGFVDGISNIIIKNLEALDVEKRPVHCCDAKRETMYIKDHDKWEKEDNELKQMRELVRYVRDKNISMVNTWRDMYPECVKSDSKKTTQYNQIYMESFGGETGGEKGTKLEKEEKIISRIAKSVIIDKNMLLKV